MKPRLGVNIDHVATLRQARGESYPSIVEAAHCVLEAGADQITIHLREDRRHIQDIDVEAVGLVTKKYGRPLNLEMGAANDIKEIAMATSPEWICLVPEKREEKTTEGGLDLLNIDNFEKIKATVNDLKVGIEHVKISLFVEAELETLKKCHELGVDAVEIHTGEFAKSFLEKENTDSYIEVFKEAKAFCLENKINCHAGHGLTQESVAPLLRHELFEEYNIGHWIISQALFDGLGKVVKDLKSQFQAVLD